MVAVSLIIVILDYGSCSSFGIFLWRISYIVVGVIILIIGVLPAQLLKRDPGKIKYTAHGSDQVEKQKPASIEHGLSIREAIHPSQYWRIIITFVS